MTIPKIIHYCFWMAEDFGGKEWSLVHHVCLASALDKIKPEKVYLYYAHEPRTAWWDLSRELVTPVKITAPAEIYGRPLMSPAHQADVVRLTKLIDHGGIYLDADVFVHKSFDDLLEGTTVLGEEGPGGHFGVGNAVMLAMPRSLFLTRWLDQYRWFRGGKDNKEAFWNEHSVQLPHFLRKLYPQDVTVLSHLAFYWPLWIEQHLDGIFRSNTHIDLTHSYTTHLWESAAWAFLKDLTPDAVRAQDTNFAHWARPYLDGIAGSFGAHTGKA
jgi:hypothetical protein